MKKSKQSVANDIIKGLKECLLHIKGKKVLRTAKVEINRGQKK